MPVCKTCSHKTGFMDIVDGNCRSCHQKEIQEAERARREISNKAEAQSPIYPDRGDDPNSAAISAILLTTEMSPDLEIERRLEILTSECVLGVNLFKDIGSAVRDIFGGRNEGYQRELRNARRAALHELKAQAYELGADAVIAVSLHYSEISGGGKSMLLIAASGTAVCLAK
jgi:uncharacterized protein YbjQ (UPF0145 family)